MDRTDQRIVNDDPHDLKRFLDAQRAVYPTALAELVAGRKLSHWMWFVFPQVSGLGYSPMAQRFAIKSRQEARAYLEHPVLGARLGECVAALLRLRGKSATAVMGTPDDLKLRSSMTLFAAIEPSRTDFSRALHEYFDDEPDPLTLAILERWG